jgi:hypothetical protein
MAEGKCEHCVLSSERYTLQCDKHELKFTKYGKWSVPGARGKHRTQSSCSFRPLILSVPILNSKHSCCHFSSCIVVILVVD